MSDAVHADQLPLTAADVDLLAELLASEGLDGGILSEVEATDIDRMPLCGSFRVERAWRSCSESLATSA